MISWGWSGMAHDASLAVFNNTKLEFAAHSERYSRIKNDQHLFWLVDPMLGKYNKRQLEFYNKR